MAMKKNGIFKIIIIVAVIAVTHGLWMPLFAKFLIVKDNVQKADAVVVLSGDWAFGREKKAAGLYNAGYALKVVRVLEKQNTTLTMVSELLGTQINQKDAYIRYFASQGVSEDALILGDMVATSTFDEMIAARQIILKNNFKSIILVTSDYHMRRALLTTKWLLRHDGIKVYSATAYSQKFNPDKWWLREDDIRGVIFEYLTLCLYLCYHFVTGR